MPGNVAEKTHVDESLRVGAASRAALLVRRLLPARPPPIMTELAFRNGESLIEFAPRQKPVGIRRHRHFVVRRDCCHEKIWPAAEARPAAQVVARRPRRFLSRRPHEARWRATCI